MKMNRMARMVGRLEVVPVFLRARLLSRLFGRFVPFAGTAGVLFEELAVGRVSVSLDNRRRVQNHIKGIHATAMALIAETATGFCVGLSLPDDKLPLLKSMKIDYRKRSKGAMRAVATLSDDQLRRLVDEDKGDVVVPVSVTDESGEEPISCEIVWAWIPKDKDRR